MQNTHSSGSADLSHGVKEKFVEMDGHPVLGMDLVQRSVHRLDVGQFLALHTWANGHERGALKRGRLAMEQALRAHGGGRISDKSPNPGDEKGPKLKLNTAPHDFDECLPNSEKE